MIMDHNTLHMPTKASHESTNSNTSPAARQQSNFNRYHGVRELLPLIPGQSLDGRSQTRGSGDTGSRHSVYQVQTSDRTYCRNHKALVYMPDPPNQIQSNDTNDGTRSA